MPGTTWIPCIKRPCSRLIEYEDSFYEEVLAVPGVQELYKSIDESCGGLGTVLQEALKNA